MRKWNKTICIGFLFIILGFVIHSAQKRLDSSRSIHFIDRSPVFLPKGEAMKWLSMGYRGIVSDWLWIKSVLYYGRRVMDYDNPYYVYALKQEFGTEDLEHTFHQHKHYFTRLPEADSSRVNIRADLKHILVQGETMGLVEYIYPLLDRLTTVDPHFLFPYIFGGVYLMMDTGEIDEALALLNKGYQSNPEYWALPFYLGWIHWMYLNDLGKTVSYLMEAVGKEKCPSFVGDLLAGLSRNLERVDVTRMYLEGLIESTDNEEVMERIREVLEMISEETS
jgi:hypothetical protein